ncbi:monovalent cation/H(+) antiporter subunit G [Thalassomonas sp. M1454]|uniref:monovalent cation/H(+) antiporter subunit G n=1 Tax=Thalassomonas sp. M1454 TaxID=2594477 RepID=UPI00117C6F85|nr:monovalent cation/H(+) antiporter subunit G [Thalassomonas sp. M1454]TRX56449.1 monovalent cation/H(+) antiporter subunit G [Thalassomonas sp. M1454]
MELLITIVSGLFLLVGSFLCLSGGVGIIRFPDFYTRMHAVGVTDTLGSVMILTGLMMQSSDLLVIAKLIMVLLLILLVGPTTSHVLAKAAFHNGLQPKGLSTENKHNNKESSSSNT